MSRRKAKTIGVGRRAACISLEASGIHVRAGSMAGLAEEAPAGL